MPCTEPRAEFNSPFPTLDADKCFIGQASCAMSGNFPARALFVWGDMPKAVSGSGSPPQRDIPGSALLTNGSGSTQEDDPVRQKVD